MKFIEIWISCPTTETAEQIAEALVEQRLAACANIFGDVRSVYRWQGRVAREAEVLLVLKTRDTYFDDIAAKIGAMHPYETPAIVAVPILRANKAYEDWLVDSTEGPAS